MTLNKFLICSVLILFGIVVWLTSREFDSFKKPNFVSSIFAPGKLSRAHAFLKDQCTACHIPNQGVSTIGCISCHANDRSLLQRQSTAFHANIKSCKECHQEHFGGIKPPLFMDHAALAKLGAYADNKVLEDVHNQIERDFLKHQQADQLLSKMVSINSHDARILSSLNCITCHATRDKHLGLFGTSCLSCHTTKSWRIAEYKHPSSNSRSCFQCHQAPPSHYMEHFRMISMTVAGQEHANVTQCFLCHQTTAR